MSRSTSGPSKPTDPTQAAKEAREMADRTELTDPEIPRDQLEAHRALSALGRLPKPKLDSSFDARLGQRIAWQRASRRSKRPGWSWITAVVASGFWGFLGVWATAKILGGLDWQQHEPMGGTALFALGLTLIVVPVLAVAGLATWRGLLRRFSPKG